MDLQESAGNVAPGPGLQRVSVLAGVALLAIGAGGVLFPEPSSRGYGVPFSVPSPGGAGPAYLHATAVRDMSLGGLLLLLARVGDRRVLGAGFLLISAVAVGDGAIALRHSPAPRRVLPVHWGSAAILWGMAYLLLRDGPARASDRSGS